MLFVFSDFFIFIKLGDRKHSKVTKLDFSGRFLFNQKRAKWPKMDCFDNFSKWPKSESHFFLIFCMKLRVHKGSKVTDGINITQRGLNI